MGQKTDPRSFRLKRKNLYVSDWFNTKLNYSHQIKEDNIIRNTINKYLNYYLKISNIKIIKINKKLFINIFSLYPNAKDFSKNLNYFFKNFKNFEENNFLNILKDKLNYKKFIYLVFKLLINNLKRTLQKETNKKIFIKLNFIKNPFEDSKLVAIFIKDQIERRIPYRRILKQTIKKVLETTIEGVKIEVSGRLNGIEMARNEWKREGRVPLHTIDANISYSTERAKTIYGIIGIKVWLFKK